MSRISDGLPLDSPGGPSGSEAIPGGTTPVPNVLLDAVMPRLRDTELRVLLVVVRQTLGWQEGPDPARRKARDWLTQSQLMRRTGRASGAVAGAVDALVRSGLVEVTDRAGTPLRTPAERRRRLSRLYYRLAIPSRVAQNAEGPETTGSKAAVSKSEHAKANTTKESRDKNRSRIVKIVDKPVENPIVVRGGGWSKACAGTRSTPFLSRKGLPTPETDAWITRMTCSGALCIRVAEGHPPPTCSDEPSQPSPTSSGTAMRGRATDAGLAERGRGPQKARRADPGPDLMAD